MSDTSSVAFERRPSLHDIADSANVSVSTVSRYLKGQLPLRPETETRVLAAMHELGYSRAAPASRSHRRAQSTGVIGLVVPQIGSTYFGRIADAVVQAAEAHGLAVLLTSTLSNSRKQLDYVNLLVEKQVAGLIYAGNYAHNSALIDVITGGMPVVVIDEAIEGAPPVDTVLVDDYAGAYQAVTYLTTLGHRDIALVTGPASLHSVHERTRGYAEAMVKAGLDPESQVRLGGSFSEEFGTVALSRLLAADTVPTAVFAASDTIALGMMVAATTLGVSIPGDLSLVGFDDVPAAGYVAPRLTTVRTPVDVMAESAVRALAERLENPHRVPQTLITPVALVVGESTAALA